MRRATAFAIGALVFCAVAACSMVTGTLLAFLRPDVSSKISQRTVTFEERVSYQRAIEEVYWRHCIWPKENPRPKPPLQAIISAREIEQKVEDYLRKSQSVADQRRQPISAGELQAEMDRMAKHTKQAEVLRELFATLGNDPFVIAECLARPVLAERLATSAHLTGGDRWNRGEPERRYRVLNAIAVASASYSLPQILEGAGGCTDDTWTATTTVNAPDARYHHTAVWTGSEMIIWGGLGQVTVLNTGGKYDP